MRMSLKTAASTVTLIASFALTACGGGDIASTAAAGAPKGCGTFNVSVNPWVGEVADAYVVGTLAKEKLGCTVNYKTLDEQISWQGFGSGDVDVFLENWGHEDLKQKYIDQAKTAVDVGPTGNVGHIGWYVPPWMAKQYPDITDWKNLNKYADLFKTSESGGQGQLLDGDPSYVTNDAALVKNLSLNFKVVYAGSETALIQAFRQAEKNHTPLIGYFYTPQWFMNEVPLVQVKLPTYTEGCDTDPAKVACDYPTYNLDKIASTKFTKSGSPAYQLVKNFTWSNQDQNTVAGYIAKDNMSPDAAAQKWIDANPDKVAAWLK